VARSNRGESRGVVGAWLTVFEALSSDGHDPYKLTLHQALAFYKEGQQRKFREWRMQSYISRMSNAGGDDLSKFVRTLQLDQDHNADDPDTIDFSEMD
jgi:hypothetical protein